MLPRQELDREAGRALEDTCVQCGFQPNVLPPTTDELKTLLHQVHSESHRVLKGEAGTKSEVFLCKRPGCGVSTTAWVRAGRRYCSRRCWYIHRPDITGKPKKPFWTAGLFLQTPGGIAKEP